MSVSDQRKKRIEQQHLASAAEALSKSNSVERYLGESRPAEPQPTPAPAAGERRADAIDVGVAGPAEPRDLLTRAQTRQSTRPTAPAAPRPNPWTEKLAAKKASKAARAAEAPSEAESGPAQGNKPKP